MSSAYRFGRRVALPSTKQILHELRMMIASESIKAHEKELHALVNAPTALPIAAVAKAAP